MCNMSGNIKLPRMTKSLLIILILSSLYFIGCEKNINTEDNQPPTEQNANENVTINEDSEPKKMIFAYLTNEHANRNERVYFAEDAPITPKEGDYRIDSIVYAGEKLIYESIGVAFEINSSHYYFTRDEKSEMVYNWHKYEPYYIVLSRSGYDNSWTDVIGQTYNIAPNKKIEEIILEVSYNLEDIEVSLSLDGYPQLVGPYSSPNFFNTEPKSKILDGWEPIYRDGDYWIQYEYNDLTATCYYNSEDRQTKVNRIETTRTDVYTHRGIRVGATRDEVLNAYPKIYNTSYWGYEGDYLWYCNNADGFGPALLFWFENNTVVTIEINNMFD